MNVNKLMENIAEDSSDEEIFYDCSNDDVSSVSTAKEDRPNRVLDNDKDHTVTQTHLPSEQQIDSGDLSQNQEILGNHDSDKSNAQIESATIEKSSDAITNSDENNDVKHPGGASNTSERKQENSEAGNGNVRQNKHPLVGNVTSNESTAGKGHLDEDSNIKPPGGASVVPQNNQDNSEEDSNKIVFDSTTDAWNDSPSTDGTKQQGDDLDDLESETAKVEDNSDDGESSEDETLLSEGEIEERKNEAKKLKDEGNENYKNGEFVEAERLYSEGLKICPKRFQKERAVMFSNRSACLVKMEKTEPAIEDCSKAIELYPTYLKAYLRRAQLYEKIEKFEEAVKDYEKALEMDPSIHTARAALLRLPEEIEKRNEKLKAQMMSSLKDLGNLFLRPFGLSTNNFQMQQDPSTGSYNVQFNNNPGQASSNNEPPNGK